MFLQCSAGALLDAGGRRQRDLECHCIGPDVSVVGRYSLVVDHLLLRNENRFGHGHLLGTGEHNGDDTCHLCRRCWTIDLFWPDLCVYLGLQLYRNSRSVMDSCGWRKSYGQRYGFECNLPMECRHRVVASHFPLRNENRFGHGHLLGTGEHNGNDTCHLCGCGRKEHIFRSNGTIVRTSVDRTFIWPAVQQESARNHPCSRTCRVNTRAVEQ
jgi:hypothetical protein